MAGEGGENERGRCEETEGGKNVNATFHNLANSVMDLSANACSSDNSCTLHLKLDIFVAALGGKKKKLRLISGDPLVLANVRTS